MSSSFLEQHLELVKGVKDKTIKMNMKKNRKSIVDQVNRDLKVKESKREQLLKALAKPQQRKHSVSEIKKVIKMNRKSQKAPRRKLKDAMVKSSNEQKKNSTKK